MFGATRAQVECAIRHAATSVQRLPIRAYCAESLSAAAGAIEDCAYFASGPDARKFREDLREVWPALSIVAWTGESAPIGFKLGAFLIPPFRVLVLNEAGDFFPATPREIARHAQRRMRDACVSAWRRMACWKRWILWRIAEFAWGRFRSIHSFARHAVEKLRDAFRLFWSLAYRGGERARDAFNWIWEVFLALLGHSAGWTAPLARPALNRVRRRQQRIVSPARNDRFVEVGISNRGWPRRRLARAVAKSDAEFVVLRHRDERASTEEIQWLIGIARDTGAFCVAKQTAHSAWRNPIVNKHPFRRLQNGEVSAVTAPYSSLLVLRRDAVATLGVPRALTFGGALMILFWKAAAAGLRSIIAGHDGVITDEPKMELEDMELTLRLFFSRSLVALGSLRPARSRGNLAWSPAHRKNFRGKPRVLVVSPYLPFPLSHGGAVRIWNLCRALADRVDFVLASFREANDHIDYDRLHEVFREVYVVDQDEKPVDPALPKQVAEYRNPAMVDLVRSLCLAHRVDLVQLEYTQVAEYREAAGAIPVILVEHDITFTLYRQLSDFNETSETRVEYQRWLDFEREALQCSSMVWTVSDEDAAIALRHGATRDRVRVIPNGVDLSRFQPGFAPQPRPVVLFVGSLRHLPNLLALEALRESIMPAVWCEIPDAILHVIAGPDHERTAVLAGKKNLIEADRRIRLEGFVADVRPAYRGADIVAIPLPVSAGTNLKVIEAMACGRAIVTTAAGCRGLDLGHRRELIVAELSDFAAALAGLLRNDDLRKRIAAEARRTAERRFGWETIADDAMRCYEGLIDRPASVLSAHA